MSQPSSHRPRLLLRSPALTTDAMSEPGGLFFLRPAKTSRLSLVPRRCRLLRLQFGRAAGHGVASRALSPLAGRLRAVVLRSPLDRFVSAWHESATFRADRGCALLHRLLWPANASDFWSWLPTAYRLAPGCTTCKVFARTAPTESRPARLVGAGSPLGFARWLRRDANDRAAWISAPAHGVYGRDPGAASYRCVAVGVLDIVRHALRIRPQVFAQHAGTRRACRVWMPMCSGYWTPEGRDAAFQALRVTSAWRQTIPTARRGRTKQEELSRST